MKKTAVALMASLFVSVMAAVPALADSSLPRPHVGGVGAAGGASGIGGTAFTGAALSPIVVAFVLLAIVGVSAIILERRRSTS